VSQLIYPQREQDLPPDCDTDTRLRQVLEWVELAYLLERFTLDTIANWEVRSPAAERRDTKRARDSVISP